MCLGGVMPDTVWSVAQYRRMLQAVVEFQQLREEYANGYVTLDQVRMAKVLIADRVLEALGEHEPPRGRGR